MAERPFERPIEHRALQDPPALRALPIVDAHHHLWNLDAIRYPWLDDAIVEDFMLGDYAGLRQDYEARRYLADAAGFRLVGTVHCEAEADRGMAIAETRWLASHREAHGFPNALVAWADFASPALAQTLDAHLATPLVRGIRCKPRLPDQGPGDFANPDWLAGLALAQARGLSWDLRVPWTHLDAAAPVAARHDATPIVLNHCGLPWDRSLAAMAQWRRGLTALGRLSHVHVKLSELGLRDAAWSLESNLPVLREVIDIFGPERCLFASNFPVAGLRVSFADWAEAVDLALHGCSADERAAVFAGNAARVYRIDIDVKDAPPLGRSTERMDIAGSQPGAAAKKAAFSVGGHDD